MTRHRARAPIPIAWLAGFSVLVLSAGCAPADRPATPAHARNPALADLPEGRWVKIHQQRPGDAVSFVRQRHGGSAFDSRRGRLVLFGSDTHDVPGGTWLNSPLVFDLNRLEWQQPYPADPVSGYRATADGLPVAGPQGDHPWAMHTFGAVTYDPATDTIVVASFPDHLAPGRFTSALSSVWPAIKRHPTWTWHPGSGRWQPLAGDAVPFFAYATAYDTRRNVVLGYLDDGVYALSPADGKWRKIAGGGLLGWGNNAAFDSQNDALIVYGSHRGGNDIVAYEPATGLHRRMPTPGKRPPGGTYVPMAFHPGIGRTVVLVQRPPGRDAPSGTTETWQYDYSRDAWTRLERADLPFAIDMNYNLEYDPDHDLLLLVATPPDASLPAVWALDPGGTP
jgi:hypothetical protein